MEITLAEEQAFFLPPTITPEQARERAWDYKVGAFGTLTKLWSRPKPTEITLSYSEMRYEPFWHVICQTRYVYDRRRDYRLLVPGPEVEALTIAGERRAVVRQDSGNHIVLQATEHCREEEHLVRVLDARTGEEQPEWGAYLEYPAHEIENLETFAPAGAFVMPPQIRASSIVREMLGKLLRPIQADQMLEEMVRVDQVHLYYRPIYAFEYYWEAKERYAIVELDGLTGDRHEGGQMVRQQLQGMLNKELLFDIGVDTVDLIVPGGGIAMKLARVVVDASKSSLDGRKGPDRLTRHES
ncbi:MAG: hypothetical protein KKA73_06705 [Chloroflexi bacterium]|nr:hypothetical protein [Chloroflexota bacterium]MBU1747362.1 hypothetical protein [Chloroflexota bacterium]